VSRRPNGFTLIELLMVVVIIGLLASLAIARYRNTKEMAIIAALKSDLRTVATLQTAFASSYNDFAGGVIASGTPDTTGGGSGRILFIPSPGNTVTITYHSNLGWSAVATSTGTSKQCGIYGGPSSGAPNAAVTSENLPECW